MDHPTSVVGDQLGLAFPTTIEPLREMGVDFLTRAFQATGALGADNRVTAITDFTEFYGGGMGRKLWLSVEYEKEAEGLQKDLFAKFPREFGDPLRELFGPLMEPEVRFALLSRRDGFPIAVPKCYFADYNAATTSGILITERIHYGQGNIERCHDKCMDYKLADPLAHYQALTKTMARLAGHHKSGKFGPGIDQQFPFDPKKVDTGARIPYTPAQLRGKLDKLMSFAAAAPQLFPPHLGAKDFLARLAEEAPLVLEHEMAIRSYLNESADFITLCHWNMNLDNAWFWKDDSGELHAGLLDWGSVAQMNLAQAFYGMTCAAEAEFLNQHNRGLMELFVDEYRRSGGPKIDVDELAFMYKLSVALLGIAWILDAPSLVEAQIPDFVNIKNSRDPKLTSDFLAHAQLQLLVVLLNEWQFDDVGDALRDFATRKK